MRREIEIGGATLLLGDCFDRLAGLESGSVDLVLCDPPYGTTAARWDAILPFGRLWPELRRVIKPGAAVVLTSAMPFTVDLINSNRKAYRYSWIWRKNMPTGYANAKKRPMKETEDVSIFCDQAPPYFPQGLRALDKPRPIKAGAGACETVTMRGPANRNGTGVQIHTGYPRNVLEFACERGFHPTQKPVALMRYMIETYSRPGDLVLDFTMGSGTTGVACLRSGRKFVGYERDPRFYAIAERRLDHESIASG